MPRSIKGFEDIVDNSVDADDISIVKSLFAAPPPPHACLIHFSTGTDEADNHFDAIIGALEDLIMEGEFSALQSGFFRAVLLCRLCLACQHLFSHQHCSIFDASEENKLEYTSMCERDVCPF